MTLCIYVIKVRRLSDTGVRMGVWGHEILSHSGYHRRDLALYLYSGRRRQLNVPGRAVSGMSHL